MAVRHGYGKIAGTDALVFAYDTGDARNSYRGEPTENFANTDTARTLVKHDASSVMTFADAPEKGPGWKKVNITERSANNFRYAQFPYISNPGGTQRTYSIEYDAGSLTGYGWRIDGSGGYNTTTFTGTGRYQMTITPGATGVYALFLTNGSSATGINDTVYYRFYQVENNSHATQFVNGTRSSTQGLLDLTGTSTIDLANVSFDSNAQITFDGTGDNFRTNTNCGITGNITLEAIFKEYSGTAPHTTVICTDINYRYGVKLMSYKNYDRYGLWLGFGSSDYLATVDVALSNNVTYHLIGTWEQSTGIVKLYLNGELTGTVNTGQTSAISLSDGIITLGQDYHGSSNSYGINGDIYLAKAYNRVLTADEIRNNYNHYKTRYKI